MTETMLRLDGFLPYRLSFTSNLVSDSIAQSYQALFGINIPEWRIIAWVAEAPGVTQQEIGARTRMDKVTVSRAAIALVERGLLERQPNPQDRRSHRLDLTADGRALYATIAPKALELEQLIFVHFGEKELADFSAMLRRIDAVVLSLEQSPPA